MDGSAVREFFWFDVVIGDNDVYPLLFCVCYFFSSGDAVIHGDDKGGVILLTNRVDPLNR